MASMSASLVERESANFELRFQSLRNAGHAISFPCDASGEVNMDKLSEVERVRYFYARAVIGREFSFPLKQRRSD